MSEKAGENMIFIGKKPSLAYVLAAVTQFNGGQAEIKIRARGRAIQKAVDVAEIIKNRFVQTATVRGITIGTEQLESESRGKVNVSTIEIALAK